jgi:hypothetical protein
MTSPSDKCLIDVFSRFQNLAALLKAYCDLAPMCDHEECVRLATRATPVSGSRWCDLHHAAPPDDVELKCAAVSRLIQATLDASSTEHQVPEAPSSTGRE